jgi:hypothetical protein
MKWPVLFVVAMMGLVSSPSSAAKHVISGGAGAVTNDPFLYQRFVSIGYETRPGARISFGGDLQFSPDLAAADWKPITKQLIEENHVSPDISKIQYAGRVGLTVFPVHHIGRTYTTKFGFGTSTGLVRTSESLEALGAESTNERAVVTQHQLHPCFGTALSAEVWRNDGFGIRMRRDQLIYIETVNGTILEMKTNKLFYIDLMRQF